MVVGEGTGAGPSCAGDLPDDPAVSPSSAAMARTAADAALVAVSLGIVDTIQRGGAEATAVVAYAAAKEDTTTGATYMTSPYLTFVRDLVMLVLFSKGVRFLCTLDDMATTVVKESWASSCFVSAASNSW